MSSKTRDDVADVEESLIEQLKGCSSERQSKSLQRPGSLQRKRWYQRLNAEGTDLTPAIKVQITEASIPTLEDHIEGMEYESHYGDMRTEIQEAVTEAVQEAVQAARDEGIKFDVRANLYTLLAISGVVLYWRGIWTTWDFFFGFSIWSELGAILTGLAIMIIFRICKLPLLDGLPSG